MNAVELQKERTEVRSDLLAGKKPKRIFITPNFTMEAACGLAGINLLEAHYNMELFEKALTKVCETFYSDVFAARSTRFAGIYQLLGAKNWTLGSNGTVQHPEIETMTTDDYDEYNAAPLKTIMEKFLPRVCTALNKDPVTNQLNLAKAWGAYKNV